MYFDDFEIELDLANSFDAMIEEELGQEIDVQVDIPMSSLPTKTEGEVIPYAQQHGMQPQLTGLPGHANRQRIDIIPEIAKEVEERRKAGEDVDVGALTEQRIFEHRQAQAEAKWGQAAKAFEALGQQIPAAPVMTWPTATGTPKPQRASPVTSDLAALQRRELVDDIVKDLTERLIPRLKKIDKRLKLAAAQRKATDEHNILMEKEKFRQQVILELKHLSQLLPVNHPVRDRISAL